MENKTNFFYPISFALKGNSALVKPKGSKIVNQNFLNLLSIYYGMHQNVCNKKTFEFTF